MRHRRLGIVFSQLLREQGGRPYGSQFPADVKSCAIMRLGNGLASAAMVMFSAACGNAPASAGVACRDATCRPTCSLDDEAESETCAAGTICVPVEGWFDEGSGEPAEGVCMNVVRRQYDTNGDMTPDAPFP